MYVHSVKLINYKSIGDCPESEIILEPRITAVIGKNESGKSNVLNGLAQIQLITGKDSAFTANNANRNAPTGTKIRFEIILKPSETDKAMDICEDTIVVLEKGSYVATGGLLNAYVAKVDVHVQSFVEILDAIGKNPFQLNDQERQSYNGYREELLRTNYLNTPRKSLAFEFMKARIGKLPPDIREKMTFLVEAAQLEWAKLFTRLPAFFYREADKHLNTIYKLEDVDKELKSRTVNPNSLLREFVKVIDIPEDDFVAAVRSGTTPTQISTRKRINRAVNEKINQKFREFYATERISLELFFDAGVLSFSVQSEDGEALMLSERSNGLRWYLDTFIDAQANDISERNVVYLLDEPGTSLHVNAQQELLNLFGHLADKGNQIVYTTHSPYMLDLESEGVHRIRAVTKDNAGYSHIYKTAYDARIAPDCQQDTLAPIVNALGMSIGKTFGPANNKLNIVTEGMSDYIYLCTMAKYCDINLDQFAILPSVGASNCIMLCQILHGWGCKYKAVFDYDTAGVETGGERMRKEMFLECDNQYCYVREVSPEEIATKTYKASTFMIEDVMTHPEIDRFCEETGTSKDLGKPLTAKLMCNAIENGSFVPSWESTENFKKLFARILK